jgi:hypothetical protein
MAENITIGTERHIYAMRNINHEDAMRMQCGRPCDNRKAQGHELS